MNMNAVLLVGRILFSLIFLSSGIGHLTKTAAMTGYAQYKKVPAAKLSVIVTGIMILLGGLSLILGLYADLGALLLVIFLLPTAFMMHGFWAESDATAKQTEMVAFLKDLALAGAALIVYAALRHGADFGPHVGTLLAFKK
jgi:uncharacterized membrane protein YphA (DoxX/SURF4 family)